MVIPFGRYGLFVWPIWFVADMVQTQTSVVHNETEYHAGCACMYVIITFSIKQLPANDASLRCSNRKSKCKH